MSRIYAQFWQSKKTFRVKASLHEQILFGNFCFDNFLFARDKFTLARVQCTW